MNKELLNKISELCVCFIEMSFADEIGNATPPFSGTAFWIMHNDKILLVTNRHNIDVTMHPSHKNKKLIKFRILMRQNVNGSQILPQWVDINLENIDGSVHQEADVAILNIKDISTAGNITCLSSEDIADENYFREEVRFLDPIFFIGYPQDWYDTTRMLPIARIGHIASNPNMAYSNKKIKISQNTTLVTGLSFGGNSGSIVIAPEDGLEGITTNNSKHRPAKCLGIMSGHLQEEKLLHSGLSYFTRSSAIHEVLRGERVKFIKNCIELIPIKNKSFEM